MTYQPKVYREQGSNRLVVASGGEIQFLTGGKVVPNSGTQAAAIVSLTDSTTGTAGDVVNEAIDDARPGLQSTVFSRGLGPDYVAEAFRLARQTDPEAQLVYNDYGGEGLNRKSNDVYNLVRDLKQRGLVDGVGLQMHVSATGLPALADVAANIRRLAALGLQVNISEMDVRVRDVPGDSAAKLERQRQVYRDIVAVCVAEPRCEAVTFWGFTDAHSWIDGRFGADDPLLFDEQYRAKPAFFGVQDAFLGR